MDDLDPYELHARRFLDRLQQLTTRARLTNEDLDAILAELNRCWPQVLAGFRWSTSHRKTSAAAAEIGNALLDSAGGGADLGYSRSAQELRRWSTATSDYAKRLQEPNDAAFLFRFAGIALVESGIVEIARETRTKVSDVLALAGTLLAKGNSQSEANVLNSESEGQNAIVRVPPET